MNCVNLSGLAPDHPGEVTMYGGTPYCLACLKFMLKRASKREQERARDAAMQRHPTAPQSKSRLDIWKAHDAFCDCNACVYVGAHLDDGDDF